jgi:arylsulfatase
MLNVHFILMLCLGLLSSLIDSTLVDAAATPQQPNIIFLMADQLRADVISPDFTPNLWSLSQRGLTLRTYTSTPSCTPARSALLTGLSPWYHGMLGYGDVAPAWPYEMPRAMSELGYRTASIGKNHYYNAAFMQNSSSTPPSHGWEEEMLYDGLGSGMDPGASSNDGEFDTYDAWFANETGGLDPLATGKPHMDWNSWRGASYVYNESLHPTAWVGQTAVSWLNAAAAKTTTATNPFFLKVSFHRPHSPYDPPERLLNATPASMLPPVHVSGTWDAKFADPQWCGPKNDDAWCGEMPPDTLTVSRRAYRASVRFVDEWVGHIVTELNSSPTLAANTWIIFLSDHGDGQGDHHLFRKTFPWELSARVPGFITWPEGTPSKAQRGSSPPLLGELRDVFATVLDLSGTPASHPLNGTSWACLVREDPTGTNCGLNGGKWRASLDLEHSTIFNDTNHWSAIVSIDDKDTSMMKYIFLATTGQEMLHNLTADPFEIADVSMEPAYQGVLTSMRTEMGAQFISEGRGPGWVGSDGLPVVRPQGTTYGPNFPKVPTPTPTPSPPVPPCNAKMLWNTTSGGYWRGDSIAPFQGLTLTEAQSLCCADTLCEGITFDAKAKAGYTKSNNVNGWIDSSVFIGSYKTM